MKRDQYARVPKARTGADRLREAIGFVWYATDRIIADQTLTGEKIAAMKGVTASADITQIVTALAERRAGVL